MSKTETLRQCAAQSNETRLERLATQLEAVKRGGLGRDPRDQPRELSGVGEALGWAAPRRGRRIAARGLAKHYGGDPSSADSRHYGCLAGFTNQKPAHTRDGRQPYVLAHDCPGKAATAAPAYLERIEQGLAVPPAEKERQTRLEAIKTAKLGYGGDPIREYQQQAQRLLAKYGEGADLSRMDWMIATDMAKFRRFVAQDIERAIREASPNLETRKAGHIEDYARRTTEKAWRVPEVQTHRQERQAQRGRDRGFSRRPVSPAGGGGLCRIGGAAE